MNILEVENNKNVLTEKLNSCSSVKQKVFLISDFIDLLFSFNDSKIKAAYLNEFLNDYLIYLSQYEPFCIHPCYSKQIIEQLKILEEIEFLEKYRERIFQLSNNIQLSLNELENILAGKNYDTEKNAKTMFPVLEKKNYIEDLFCGSLESLTIKIEKSKTENSFLIIPRERELEERIKKQVQDSWNAALIFCKKYIRKIHSDHKVFIYFDKMQGIYEGNSLGIALTLEFIEELLAFYNAPTIVKIKNRIAFTGGIDVAGNIEEVSKEIIENKTECIFFSPIETFVLHRNDEAFALAKFEELKKEFPGRKLEIIGVTTLDDLLNRRNLVDIRKQNPVVRAGKAARRNTLSLSLTVLLIAIIIFSGIWDFDDNPMVLSYENKHLRVLNANKKLLWSEKVDNVGVDMLNHIFVKRHYAMIYDINNDGNNEIILSDKLFKDPVSGQSVFDVVCLNKVKNIVWAFQFDSTVATKNITFSSKYVINFLGIYKIEDKQLLFVSARNEYFPSAVFGIDILTGERVTNIFWHSGHIADGFIFYDDAAGKNKILLAGINNGFEAAAVMILDYDNLSGQAVAPENYMLKEISPAKMNEYILIPPSDYAKFYGSRYNAVVTGYVRYHKKENLFNISVSEDTREGLKGPHIHYYLNSDLSVNFIETGDAFQNDRDRLVKEGKLSLPLTYTEEYFYLLKSKILYWDGERFVNKKPH